MNRWLEAVREAIRAELGPEAVRCRECRLWFRRPGELEPWVAATTCGGCA